MKLSIHLVTWNGAKYISSLFDSIKKNFKLPILNFTLLIFDNGSTDNTVALLKKELADFSLPYTLIELKENTGFAGGHNRLFELSDAEYVLIVNQDMVFEPDCIATLAKCLDAHPDAAVVAPRLMKWSHTDADRFLTDSNRSQIIDSLGLRVYRSRRVVNSGEGKVWSGGSGTREVFGVAGTCALFRRRAIEGEFFDSLFGSYKEDVDLAYRLRSQGLRAYVCLDAVAYHARSAVLGEKKSAKTRYESYRNHLMVLYKNEYWQNLALDFPWILWYEGRKFLYYLFVRPSALRGLLDIWKHRNALREKRQRIAKKRVMTWKEMRTWYA